MSFFSSRSMSAPGPWCSGAENGDRSKRGEDRAEDSVIHSPGDGCADERQGREQNEDVHGLGVHFCSRLEGAATGLLL
jgi:hypothetical protein